MGVTDSLKNDALSMVGIIEHAKFIFPEKKDVPVKEGENKKYKSSGLTGGGLSTSQSLLAASAQSVGTNATNVLSNATTGKSKTFTVQFNPASMQFSALSTQNSDMYVFSADSKKAEAVETKTSGFCCDVSFKLYFDAVNNQDAFGQDKYLMNLKDIAYGVGTAIQEGITGKEYSVQKQVEGFHAAVLLSDDMLVNFIWGKMSIEARIVRLNTTYTMFSPTGNPIRAVADITLRCEPNTLQQWQQQAQTLLGSNAPVLTQRVSQGVSNLLNI